MPRRKERDVYKRQAVNVSRVFVRLMLAANVTRPSFFINNCYVIINGDASVVLNQSCTQAD